MRVAVPVALAVGALLISCGSEPKPAPAKAPERVEAPKPADESRRFPMANQLKTEVIGKELMGKPFMPGGTLAHYRKGKAEYSMFVAKLPTATDAALLLLNWSKALTGARLIPSFGGYFGQDTAGPVFVFSKGTWIAGVSGLPEKEADLQARALAAHLD